MSTNPTPHPRPLSPHLQVYKLPISAKMSIFHRFTGVALTVGCMLLACWVIAGGDGADAFNTINGFLGSWFGLLLLAGWSFALYYHMCNGIRHLLWDAGWGFELGQVDASGMVALVVACGLTVVTWIAAFGLGG